MGIFQSHCARIELVIRLAKPVGIREGLAADLFGVNFLPVESRIGRDLAREQIRGIKTKPVVAAVFQADLGVVVFILVVLKIKAEAGTLTGLERGITAHTVTITIRHIVHTHQRILRIRNVAQRVVAGTIPLLGVKLNIKIRQLHQMRVDPGP
jgi:hypothetical protein